MLCLISLTSFKGLYFLTCGNEDILYGHFDRFDGEKVHILVGLEGLRFKEYLVDVFRTKEEAITEMIRRTENKRNFWQEQLTILRRKRDIGRLL